MRREGIGIALGTTTTSFLLFEKYLVSSFGNNAFQRASNMMGNGRRRQCGSLLVVTL